MRDVRHVEARHVRRVEDLRGVSGMCVRGEEGGRTLT